MIWHRSRVGRAAVTAALACLVAACGLFPPDAATQACATPAEGTSLSAPEHGIELCLPPSWRDLRPGDPGWVVVHGGAGQRVERDVAEGIIQRFAVPLAPRDEDVTVNLALYVRPIEAGTTLEEVGDQYVDVLEQFDTGEVLREDVALPAGPAIRLTSARTRGEGADALLERLVVYTLIGAGRSYHLVFVSRETSADAYAPVFEAIARSVDLSAD